jgi:hypothetical protein
MQARSAEFSISFQQSIGLFLARFCPSAWLGAATLFVIVGVTEVTRGGFDSSTKDQLVLLRFPAFYVCGVVLIGLGWVGTLAVARSAVIPVYRRVSSIILLAVVLGLMAVDYAFIYQPLAQMVNPPGQAKPAGFAAYHDASKKINLVELTLCLIVAGFMNWPMRTMNMETSDSNPRNPASD